MALIPLKVLWIEAIFFSSKFMIVTFRQEKNIDISRIGRGCMKIESPNYDVKRSQMNLKIVLS